MRTSPGPGAAPTPSRDGDFPVAAVGRLRDGDPNCAGCPCVTARPEPVQAHLSTVDRRDTRNSAIEAGWIWAPAPGAARRHVAAGLDPDRVDEVLVQVVDVLDHPAVDRAADREEVEHGQVLHHLAQADAAGVRADRHAELGRQQQDRDVLVDPADPAGVDLHDVDRPGLQQLLEHDRVGGVLAGGDPDRARPPGGSRRGRARRPATSAPRSSTGRTGASCSIQSIASAHAPELVGVDRDRHVRPDRVRGRSPAAGRRRRGRRRPSA